MPIIPRLSGCDAGKPPMPSSVIAIGHVRVLGERAQQRHRIREHHAVAGEDERTLGLRR